MQNRKIPLKERPFRSRADQEREIALQNRYHDIAVPAVVAALQMENGAAITRPAGQIDHPITGISRL